MSPGRRLAAVKRILVVDDEPNIVELLRLYLEKEGFAVVAARNGTRRSRSTPATTRTSSSWT